MSWLLSFLIALMTGLIGLLSAGFVTNAYAQWYNVTSREGAAGFLVVGNAILGGFVAAVLGLVISRLIPVPTFWKAMGCSSGIVLGIAGMLMLLFYVFADIPPRIDGAELTLEAEIRLPAGEPKPEGKLSFVLGSVADGVQRVSQPGEMKTQGARLEQNRWVLPAEAFLFTTRGKRMITAEVDGKTVAAFMVPLPGRPGKRNLEWSDWLPHPKAGSPPWPDSKASYRYRVQRIPPPPTRAERQAQEAAEEQARFEAIPPDAPITTWIPYTHLGLDEKRCTVALQRIAGKPGLVAEMNALMLDSDARQASLAMGLIGRLPQPSAELIPGVTAAGRDIVARLARFNVTTPEQDPSFEGAADVSIRFGGWMEAVRTLRKQCAGDFTAELRQILELSRVRNDSSVMRGDVRRVASYYLKEWAGVPPLPDDPPPR